MMAAPHSFQSNDALPLGSSSVYPTYTYPLAVPAQILRQSNPTELGTPDTLNASQSNPWEQNSSSLPRGVSVGDHVAPAASSKDHGHWCWDCDQKSIKLCGDFKRHMQEHENKYWCIPPDSVIYEKDGSSSCAFCFASNPDPKHLNSQHSISKKCRGKGYSRKPTLTEHVTKKHHGVDAKSMVDIHLKSTIYRKYYACGFCVFLFHSLDEQVKHVEEAHFKSSKHTRDRDHDWKRDWDPNKVIRGLLSQREVNEHWQAEFPFLQNSSLSWDPTLVKELQLRLEMSQEPGFDLFIAAVEAVIPPETNTSTLTQTPRYPNARSSLPSSSGQGFTPHDNAVQHEAHYRPQPYSFPSSGQSYTQQQLPAYTPSFASASSTSQAWGSHPGDSCSSMQTGWAQDCPVQAHSGWSQHALLLSHNPQTVPSGRLTSQYSPGYQPYPAARPSRQEATGYPGINTSFNTDNVQRSTQDQDFSRGQGRSN